MALVSPKETQLLTENSTFPKTHFSEYTQSGKNQGAGGTIKILKFFLNDLFLYLYPKWHINSCREVNFSEKMLFWATLLSTLKVGVSESAIRECWFYLPTPFKIISILVVMVYDLLAMVSEPVIGWYDFRPCCHGFRSSGCRGGWYKDASLLFIWGDRRHCIQDGVRWCW